MRAVSEEVRSNQASVRASTTYATTGIVLRAALGKILINGVRLINYYHTENGADNTIPKTNTAIFDSVSRTFAGPRELSWLCQLEVDKSANRIWVNPLPGVIIDQAFLQSLQPSKTRVVLNMTELDHYINMLRHQRYLPIKPRHIEIELFGLKLPFANTPDW